MRPGGFHSSKESLWVKKLKQRSIEGLPENAPELRLAALLDEYRGHA